MDLYSIFQKWKKINISNAMLSLVQIKIEARGRKLKCIDIGLLNFFTIVFDMLLLYNSFFFYGEKYSVIPGSDRTLFKVC